MTKTECPISNQTITQLKRLSKIDFPTAPTHTSNAIIAQGIYSIHNTLHLYANKKPEHELLTKYTDQVITRINTYKEFKYLKKYKTKTLNQELLAIIFANACPADCEKCILNGMCPQNTFYQIQYHTTPIPKAAQTTDSSKYLIWLYEALKSPLSVHSTLYNEIETLRLINNTESCILASPPTHNQIIAVSSYICETTGHCKNCPLFIEGCILNKTKTISISRYLEEDTKIITGSL